MEKADGKTKALEGNGFQGHGRIQRDANGYQKESLERNHALGRKVGSLGASERRPISR